MKQTEKTNKQLNKNKQGRKEQINNECKETKKQPKTNNQTRAG